MTLSRMSFLVMIRFHEHRKGKKMQKATKILANPTLLLLQVEPLHPDSKSVFKIIAGEIQEIIQSRKGTLQTIKEIGGIRHSIHKQNEKLNSKKVCQLHRE